MKFSDRGLSGPVKECFYASNHLDRQAVSSVQVGELAPVATMEGKQHLVFDCPAHSHIRSQLLDVLQHAVVYALLYYCRLDDFV